MKRLQKWLLMCSSLVTGVTGIVYFWMKRFLVPVDPFAVVGHPLEPWLLKAHILAAPVLVFALGLITIDHIWKNYRCLVPAGRRSGIAATWVIAPMVATGYLIQVVTAVGWLSALGWAHLGAGVWYLVSVVAHQQVFRRGPNVAATSAPPQRPRRRGRSLLTSSRAVRVLPVASPESTPTGPSSGRPTIRTGTEWPSKGS
jgi:hypothetical protein